jgi:hypothetical protein
MEGEVMPTVTLTLAGEPVVRSSSYMTLDDAGEQATGYDSVVVFRVKNPDSEAWVPSASYRVKLYAGAKLLAVSDGTETTIAGAGEEHTIVWIASESDELTKPTRAEVSFYPADAIRPDAPGAASPSVAAAWRSDGVTVCPEMQVQCEWKGDITFDSQSEAGASGLSAVRSVYVVLHQGSPSGPVVAAGTGYPSDEPVPDRPLPVDVLLQGVTDAQKAAIDSLVAEVYVEPESGY